MYRLFETARNNLSI